MKLRLMAGLLFGLMGVISSCGYTTRSLLPPNLRTIYVEPFKNRIDFTEEGKRNLYFPLLENDVRREIVDRYLFDGNLRIGKEGEADLILRGELLNYERNALRISEDEQVEEYRIHIVVSLQLIDSEKNEARWIEPSFVGEATYFVTGAKAKSESQALNDALEDLARRVVERTVEDW